MRWDEYASLGVRTETDARYVNAIAVMATHIMTIKTHIKNLRFNGNPLISNRMMLRDDRKPTVLEMMKMVYSDG